MMNKGRIKLLDIDLIKDEVILKKFSYWSKIVKWVPGWHYDLDMSWILKNLELLNLKKGARILDAGAGQGIMQYILALKGYHVVSLDFSKRKIPNVVKNKFQITLHNQNKLDYYHSYQDFIKLENESVFRYENIRKIFYFKKIFFRAKREINSFFYNLHYRFNNTKNVGKIDYIRAAFHDMPFQKGYFDAVISLSALEHSDYKLLDKNIQELRSVVKKSGGVFITTSGTNELIDKYDEETGGWCFCVKTLSRFTHNATDEFQKYKEIEKNIKNSKILLERLDSYYFLNKESPFYNKKLKEIPYCPIGISFLN